MNTKMTPDEEFEFYAKPENQVPTGPAVRRRKRLSEPVPVRFPDDLLQRVREKAEADDRSVSSWIRRAVEHELDRNAS
ncbi:ribbon-helix-helix domain-containing protein [Subtercola sp. PAMC28395]|nr:ribbon-helix-helix domain-containing protein [Subtercola sp. PAMC28395]